MPSQWAAAVDPWCWTAADSASWSWHCVGGCRLSEKNVDTCSTNTRSLQGLRPMARSAWLRSTADGHWLDVRITATGFQTERTRREAPRHDHVQRPRNGSNSLPCWQCYEMPHWFQLLLRSCCSVRCGNFAWISVGTAVGLVPDTELTRYHVTPLLEGVRDFSNRCEEIKVSVRH